MEIITLILFSYKKMCEIVSAKVYNIINFALGVVAITWCFIIYGENKGKYPLCDRENLEVWYLVWGIAALAVYPAVLCMATIMIAMQKNAALVGVIYCFMCLMLLDVFFLLAWWITGNVWIWNSNNHPLICGELTTQGQHLLIYQYCQAGFMVLLGCFKVKPITTSIAEGGYQVTQ